MLLIPALLSCFRLLWRTLPLSLASPYLTRRPLLPQCRGTKLPLIGRLTTPITSIHTIIVVIFIIYFLFLLLVPIFHFIIKPLPQSVYLSHPSCGSFQPSPEAQLTAGAILYNSTEIGFLHCMQELSFLLHSKIILMIFEWILACMQESTRKS